MGPVCPDCGSPLIGSFGRARCLNCGHSKDRVIANPDNHGKAPAKASPQVPVRLHDQKRAELVDAVTAVWLARLQVNRITASDKDAADAQHWALEHLDQARKHFEAAGIPWPEIPT